MKNTNYIVIHGWMVNELKLKGNELLTFALIYGFSQDESSEFTGSLSYISKWLSISKPTIIKVLVSLEELDLIVKTSTIINNIKFNKYSIHKSVFDFLNGGKETLQGGGKETLQGGGKETLQGGGKETLHNNANSNNSNIDISKWRDDFEIYKHGLREAYNSLIKDNEFIKQQEKFFPGVDIKLSIERSCVNFWATEAGWKNKKGKRTKDIDWKATLTNAISKNKVYKPREEVIKPFDRTKLGTTPVEEYKRKDEKAYLNGPSAE